MKITTVLFDLDGTLLPMDQDIFVKAYFKGLCARMIPFGYDPNMLVDAVWTGTAAMVKNDGSCLNEEAFWNTFAEKLGEEVRQYIPVLDDFYRTDFQKVQSVCGFDSRAKEVITLVKELGLTPVLATNPLFPAVATHSRTRWAGLMPEDFRYITTYENSTYCKPNPLYYREILQKLGLQPEECVMIGNDATEDLAAMELGIPVFILTDCLINKKGIDLTPYPHGSFPELMDFIRALKEK